MKKKYTLLLILFIISTTYSQDTCESAVPFCADFDSTDAVANGSTALAGPNYGCLDEQPNPTWGLLQIETAGDLDIEISQVTPAGIGIDVDYICYGPFDDPVTPCQSGELNAANTIDCSFLPDAVENFSIFDAVVGDYYILLITNYSAQNGTLTFEQTNQGQVGAASLNCDLVCNIRTDDDINSCINDTVTLTAQILNTSIAINTTYQWYKNNVFMPGETNLTLNLNSAIATTDTYKIIAQSIDCDDDFENETVVNYFDAYDNFNLNAIPAIELCDLNEDGFNTFDLTTNEAFVVNTEDINAYEFTYYSDAAHTQQINDPVNYINITAYAQTIYVSIKFLTIACIESTTFDIGVFELPVAMQPEPYTICDDLDDGDEYNGFHVFNLATLNAEILDGQDTTLFAVNYFLTQTDANLGDIANQLPLIYENETASAQIIYARVVNLNANKCFATTPVELFVNEVPVINYFVDFYQCDDNTDGFALINLEEINSIINADINNTFTYYRTANQALNEILPIPNFGTFSNAIATKVFCRVENQFGCVRISEINLHVSTSQIPLDFHLYYHECDYSTNSDNQNGSAIFNFSDATPLIKNLFPLNQNIWITYFENEFDALTETNEITSVTNYINSTPDEQQIFVRVDNSENNACLGLGHFITLNVNPLPVFTIETPLQVCIGESITLNADIDNTLNEYDFEWSNSNGVISANQAVDLTEAGDYFIKVSYKNTGCSTSESIVVTESQIPTISNYTTASFQKPFNSLIVETTGVGDYQYMLNHLAFYTFEDDRDWQESHIFNKLQAGSYILTVRDKNGCGESKQIINILDYPKFLTPNDDDTYDTWRVNGTEFLKYPETVTTYIYDRYGKVLAKLNAYEKWNGKYLGHILLENNYWFSINYIDNQGKSITEKGNISLILR